MMILLRDRPVLYKPDKTTQKKTDWDVIQNSMYSPTSNYILDVKVKGKLVCNL